MNLSLTNIASIITATTAIIVAFEVFIIYKNLKADHERSRRTFAVNLMKFFLEQQATGRIRGIIPSKFFEELPPDKMSRMFNREGIYVEIRWKEVLNTFFSQHGIPAPVENDKEIMLEYMHTNLLLSEILCYLNLLETVAAAWCHSIADREIIEAEFCSVILISKNRTILEKLRAESGSYPSLNALAERIKTKGTTNQGKPPIA